MVKVNEKLKSIIPPLTESEYNELEKSILKEGCREKLVTWNDTIVDGHNRYEICKKHGISYDVMNREFESIEDAKVWMIDNQKGRRNITDGWKYELAQVKKAILAERGAEKRKETEGRPSSELYLMIYRMGALI